jgi:hypothetical protein
VFWSCRHDSLDLFCVSRWQASCSMWPWWRRPVHRGWLHRMVWKRQMIYYAAHLRTVHSPCRDKSGLDSICLASFICPRGVRIQSWVPTLCLIGIWIISVWLGSMSTRFSPGLPSVSFDCFESWYEQTLIICCTWNWHFFFFGESRSGKWTT